MLALCYNVYYVNTVLACTLCLHGVIMYIMCVFSLATFKTSGSQLFVYFN